MTKNNNVADEATVSAMRHYNDNIFLYISANKTENIR